MTKEEKDEQKRWKLESVLSRHLKMVSECASNAKRAIDTDEKDLNKKEVLGWLKDCQSHLTEAAQIMGEQ